MNNSLEGTTAQALKYIASPLRFFALAIVLLAAIIVVLAWKSTLPPDLTSNLIITAFVGFFGIILLVIFLVLLAPKKLVFDQEAHLTMLREHLGDNEFSNSYITGSLPNVRATDVNTDRRE